MSHNLSESLLKTMQQGQPADRVKLHVMFGAQQSDVELSDAIVQLKSLTADEPVELLRRSRMALVSAPLGQVRKIADIPGVLWIDADKTAPIKSLLD